ncbi:MAG TPA: type II secretion system F family protein [Rhodopila sp.]|nr:type II secretion system F family protein [Rhodopila sp.]
MSGHIWELAIALSVLCALAGVLMMPVAQRSAQVETRIRSLRMPYDDRDEVIEDRVPIWVQLLGVIGQTVLRSGLLSGKAINDLRETVNASGSGSRSSLALPLFVGAKLVLTVGLPLLLLLLIRSAGFSISATLVIGVGGIIGLMAPDYLVRSNRKRYLRSVEAGMPAALDLLIICAEAGMALEAGFERVSAEAQDGAAATANELRITAMEMKMLADRHRALANMGARTGLDSMIRLGAVLAQSLKYGTPLAQALRTLAAEMRHSALMRFEARAARIPVLLTIPMIVFILPCIFIVVGGPAALEVMRTMLSP